MTHPADQVIHAKEVLAVADGHTFAHAAKLAGRKSGDAVGSLIARFNREGLCALETRHGGGPPIRYTGGSRVNGFCGSFDALLIAGSMALPPGR